MTFSAGQVTLTYRLMKIYPHLFFITHTAIIPDNFPVNSAMIISPTLRGLLFKSRGFLFQFYAISQLTLKLATHLT